MSQHEADALMLFGKSTDLVFKIAAFDSLRARVGDPTTPREIAMGLVDHLAAMGIRMEQLMGRVWRGANVRIVEIDLTPEGMVRLTVVMGLMGTVQENAWGVIIEHPGLVPHRFVVEACTLDGAVKLLIPLRGKVAA